MFEKNVNCSNEDGLLHIFFENVLRYFILFIQNKIILVIESSGFLINWISRIIGEKKTNENSLLLS